MPEVIQWQRIRELGNGGQSTVYLVRSPERTADLTRASQVIRNGMSGGTTPESFVAAIAQQMRSDNPSELGALKVFDKVREGGAAPELRIKKEIEILAEGYKGLPKLLASNEKEKWMITEFFPKGSLDKSPKTFEGDVERALKAFRTLVETIAHLHRTGVFHRDIKPANVFIDGQKLVPGDFGIAYTITNDQRLTVTHERVGPWDYMPQWADTGERLDQVNGTFDVYMLGKLLWCMVSGKLRLPREYHRRPEYDLCKMFPNEDRMNSINLILDRCLVEHESECLASAVQLLELIDQVQATLDSNVRVDATGQLALPCLVCKRGFYVEETVGGRVNLTRMDNNNTRGNEIYVRVFSCNVCTHRAFFAPGYPDEAAARKWKRL